MLIVNSFLVIGILVSYLPQHYKIISRRSSRGLSPMFVLLGTVSGTASIANILTLPESTRDMGCCKEIGSFPCAAALLGIAQIGVQWTCFFFMYVTIFISHALLVNVSQHAALPHLLPAQPPAL